MVSVVACLPAAQEYKLHNAEVLFREDADMDDLIDVIEGNRRYIRCLYVYNKIDVCSIEEVLRPQPWAVAGCAGAVHAA